MVSTKKCPRCNCELSERQRNCHRCGEALASEPTVEVLSGSDQTRLSIERGGNTANIVRQIVCTSKLQKERIRKSLTFRQGLSLSLFPRILQIESDGENLSVITQNLAGNSASGFPEKMTVMDYCDFASQMLTFVGRMHSLRPYPLIHADLNESAFQFDRTSGQMYLADWGTTEHLGRRRRLSLQDSIAQDLADLHALLIGGIGKSIFGDSCITKEALIDSVERLVKNTTADTAMGLASTFTEIVRSKGPGATIECDCKMSNPTSSRVCPRCGRILRKKEAGKSPEARFQVDINFDQAAADEVLTSLRRGSYAPLRKFQNYQRLVSLNVDPGFQSLLCLDNLPLLERLPHQSKAALRALRQMRGRALLADEVGLGKTIETGLIIRELIDRKRITSNQKILILCPGHVALQWQQELFEKFNLFFPVFGQNVDFALAWQCNRLIASYKALGKRIHATEVLENQYDMLILDEAHIVNQPENTQLLKTVSSLRKKYFLLLSATPIQRSLDDLYSIVSLLRPGHFDDKQKFLDRYQDQTDDRKVKRELIPELQTFLSEVMIRHTRKEVDLEFPIRRAATIKVPLSRKQLEFYNRFRDEFTSGMTGKDNRNFLLRVGAIVEAFCSSSEAFEQRVNELSRQRGLVRQIGNVFLASLQSIANKYPRDLTKNKVDLVIQYANEHSQSNAKVLVFSEFNETARFLYDSYQGQYANGFLYDQEASVELNNETLNQFRTSRQGGVLFCYGDAGVGLNLQFCRTLINYDIPWNPMKLEQRIGRIQRYGSSAELRRQGFENEIFIFNFVHAGTIEETIHESCLKVLELVTDVVGKLETILGEVGDENEIRSLIGNVFLKRKVVIEKQSAGDDEAEEQLVPAELLLKSTIECAIQTTEQSLDDDVCDFSVDLDPLEF